MGLDLTRLENARRNEDKIIARCPACAENGKDRKGEHLFVAADGRFGCVVFPADAGQEHRKRIWQLVGTGKRKGGHFEVKNPLSSVSNSSFIQKNILGRLGHFSSTYTRKMDLFYSSQQTQKEFRTSVPPVPNTAKCTYTPQELQIIEGIDSETFAVIDEIKYMFDGTVVNY